MFKSLFCFCLLAASSLAVSKVEFRWLTVASFVISDGKTSILFDPSYTRPGLMNWLNLEKLKSDPEVVAKVLKDNDLLKVDAIFSSHSHFDHVVDAPMVAKLTGATFYTDESQQRIARAYQDPAMKTAAITDGQEVTVGEFKLRLLKRTHAGILQVFDYLPGPVPSDFDFGFYDYHVGDTWCYVIHHPEGVILIDQGAEAFFDLIKPFVKTADVLIQGVANRKSNESITEGYLKVYRPKVFVPVHFDNFLGSFEPTVESRLIGVRLEGLVDEISGQYRKTKVIVPRYGEKITLFGN